MKMLYWDHAATTPPHKEVVDTMAEIMNMHYGNPSALHQAGEDAAKLLKRAREVCAAALGVQPVEIVFTSGATEGNNIAIKGAAIQYRSRGQHIITTKTEHPSVYECFKQLERLGWKVTYVSVDEFGQVDPLDVEKAIRKDTVLVSIMHVNNETGAVQPLDELGKRIKEKNNRTLFHVDGVQGFGKLPVSLKDWKVDLYTLSAHKFKGPKGAGVMYVREGIELFPLLSGGSQENGQRPGTVNVASAVAVAKAMRLAQEHQRTFYDKIGRLRNLLMTEIRNIPDFVLNSSEKGAPHIVHFSYPGLKPEVLVHTLEEHGMLVSTKSACSSRNSEPSRVLQAMGKDDDIAASGIRISLGWEHTEDDIGRLIKALHQSVDQLRPLRAKRR